MNDNKDKLYIVLVSVHGLIRGQDLELGRDADTGGQTKYVVELLRELGERPEVEQVDLLTRRIIDDAVSEDYREAIEILSNKARIVRIDCGEEGYLPKEELWDSLDNFADNMLEYITGQKRAPDIIHSHYADAGYVCNRISHQLNIPLIHTGHSLGRSKRKQLLAGGMKRDDIEQRYNISRRIDAEEEVQGTAELIITSTRQEIIEQYGMYDYYQPERMKVIPPGTDLEKFYPPQGDEYESHIYQDISRFLQQPNKPIILALSRPDHRKNINTLVEAYGESEELKQLANLVIIAGNRDEIRDMDSGAQDVLNEIFLSIDSYDLYGKVAYPKHHHPDDVPVIYRLSATSGGVFINPALTEPFGLTLIEAAASGVPIVATEDGGPTDIIDNCHNGYLIDPLDKQSIIEKLLKVLTDRDNWKRLAHNGIEGVRQHYSWRAHVDRYLKLIKPVADKSESITKIELKRRPMLYHDRALITDLDQNLLGNPQSLKEFVTVLQENRKCTTFGIATGRRLDSALKVMKQYHIPLPDFLITSLGTEIYYNPGLTRDVAWSEHIDHMWRRRAVLNVLKDLPGLELQPKREQSKYKVSYYYDAAIAPDVNEIIHLLYLHDQSVNVVLAFGQYLDIVPVRASKGFALRWFAEMWGIPLEHILAAGGSGADEDMMRGNTLSVVVANRHHEELSELVDSEDIYFADRPFAAGILQAVEHYDFFRECKVNS
ncbi:MAG: HAD-IIB family hydrolase [Gammaproteobacteria bacterium]|nr:HAD-IIB family hydrolase [Gammaproteobacteria bacterium]NNJ49203.1 HAD-IIB family hydrolase [Gammaproteobacteria bacterium]